MAKERKSSASPAAPLPSGLVTFMFTDIINSTKMKGLMPGETSSDRQETFLRDIKAPHEAIVSEHVRARGGVIVKSTGDGFFIAFPDAEKAVLCGVEIQEKLTAAAIPTPLGNLQVRIGLNSGQADPVASDYTASAVDKAARVESKAEGGQVFISRETHSHVVDKVPALGFAEVGDYDMKGVGKETLYVAFRSGKNPVAEIEDKYRQHLIERFGKLTLYSLSSDQPIAVDLEQVFVKLTGTERRPEYPMLKGLGDPGVSGMDITDAAFRYVRSKNPTIRQIRFESPEVGQIIVSPPEAEALLAASVEVKLSISEALRAHSHLAIIGAPGAGKTTLLMWLALAYARREVKNRLELDEDRLPLFVALRDFNRFLDNLDKREGLPSPLSPALLARHLQEYYAEYVSHLNLPAGFFLRALATGRALVLLDGLDEVAVSSKRARTAEFVAACVRAYPGCRFVLTSRPRGYENDCRTHLSALCSECRVRDFDDDDIAAFARNWYLAVTLAREGDNPTARDRAESAEKNLQAAVKQERVRPLAANPLLLSILALIHQKGVGLPQRRVELYQECTEFLLGYWDEVREGDVGRELANLNGWDRHIRRKLLEPIALWMHERGENRTEAHRDELIPKLAEQFQKSFGGEPEQATLRAEDFVNVIALRTGILVEKEAGVFEFAHPTFREYLASCSLMNRVDYVQAVLAHLHDPWWNEVHLLAIADIGTGEDVFVQQRVSCLLTAIRDAKSWLEDDLHRDLLFAFHALCDVGPLGVEDAFRRELIEAVFVLWRDTKVRPLRDRIEQLFNYAGATPVGGILVDSLIPLLKSRTSALRGQAAEALGHLGAQSATKVVLGRLLELTQDGNTETRRLATWALGKLGARAATSLVFTRLLELLYDPSPFLHHQAVWALGELGAVSAFPVVLERLLGLCQNADRKVRWRAVWALGQLGAAAATPDVLVCLLELTHDADDDVRRQAVWALTRFGAIAATSAVLSRLLELSQHSNSSLRHQATEALGELGTAAATPTILSRLLELTQDVDDEVGWAADRVLGRLGATATNPQILAQLLKLAQDSNANVRGKAARTLGTFGMTKTTSTAVAGLLELTHDSNASVRRQAAYALGQLGSAVASQIVRTRLLSLTQDEAEEVREGASWALSQLGGVEPSPEILARLLELAQDSNSSVRHDGAEMLGLVSTAAVTPAVPGRLLRLIHDGDEEVRWAAAEALGHLGTAAATPAVLEQLLNLIQDKNSDVLRLAAWALGRLVSVAATEKVLSRLIELTEEGNSGLRLQATWVLSQMNTKLTAAQAAVSTSFCQSHLTSNELRHEFIGGEYLYVSQFAFDTLHRLAAQRARLGPAKPAARAKKTRRPRSRRR